MTDSAPPAGLKTSGAAAIEFAIVFPLFALCVFGLIEFGRATWTEGTLNYAVQSASRCGAIDKNNCATNGQIQAWAAASTLGFTVDASQFVVDTSQTCGVKVSITLPFDFAVPAVAELLSQPITLSASSCFPKAS